MRRCFIMDKNPLNWPVSLWLFAVIMAILGGIVHYLTRAKSRQRFKPLEFFGELFFCGFVGLNIFFALAAYDQPVSVCAIGAAIGGHSSTRLIFVLEKFLDKKIDEVL